MISKPLIIGSVLLFSGILAGTLGILIDVLGILDMTPSTF